MQSHLLTRIYLGASSCILRRKQPGKRQEAPSRRGADAFLRGEFDERGCVLGDADERKRESVSINTRGRVKKLRRE